MVLAVKLGLVAILLLLTLTHDLVIGPRVGKILQLPTESRSRFDQVLVLWSPWVARLSLFLALAVLLAAVVLVRSNWSISLIWSVWFNQTNETTQIVHLSAGIP